MNNNLLAEKMDEKFINKMKGYAYARTNNSYEAQDLCSEILCEVIKSMKKGVYIKQFDTYVWTVAHNVYANYCRRRKKEADSLIYGEEYFFSELAMEDTTEDTDAEQIRWIIKRIAFLSKAYRDVIVSFYLDGMSVKEIATKQQTSISAIQQRLFSARQEIRSELGTMEKIKKTISFETIEFELIGTGNPSWGDPRSLLQRQLSKQIVWACKKKAKTTKEISEELGVPMIYVEEELELLTNGVNGYGMLKRTGNGRYCHNVLILDKRQKQELIAIYEKHMKQICEIIAEYVMKHKEEYLSFPFLNRKVTENMVFWMHTHNIAMVFGRLVARILGENYMKEYLNHNREFSIYGYLDDGTHYGCGWDGIQGHQICGYQFVEFQNLYNSYLKKHFHCGWNISKDKKLQLALMAIEGISIDELEETMREEAALAIREGYLYREGDKLYTKILGCRLEDANSLYDIDDGVKACFGDLPDEIAKEIFAFIQREIPSYLLTEAQYANSIASLPMVDQFIEKLIELDVIQRPENIPGPEGCMFLVQK